MTIEKEVAIITGAGRGIGLATAKRLLEDGFHVVMVDVSADPLTANAAELRSVGNSVEDHVLSVTDRAAVADLVASLPRLDVLVNNAAIFWDGKFDEVREDDFRKMYEVNVVGAFIMAQEAARRMERGARIINLASRAFALFYFVQSLVALLVARTAEADGSRGWRMTRFGASALLCLAVVLFAVPSGA